MFKMVKYASVYLLHACMTIVMKPNILKLMGGLCGHGRMAVGLISTYAIGDYHH